MNGKQEFKREVYAVILIIVIFVSLIGTFTVLSVTDQLKQPKTTAQVVQQAPGVSLSIQQPTQEEDDVLNGN